jgi:hypothetical protein
MNGEPARRYHLFDRAEALLLVADQGSPWLPADLPPQVRFSRPDGDRLATMDLPRGDDRRPDRKQNYAIIYEHAVYALITSLDLSGGTAALNAPPPAGPPTFDRLVIEVEGHRWLGLRWNEEGDNGPLLVIYDAAAADLPNAVDPEAADLPEPIGLLEVGAGDYDYDLTLPAGRLAQTPLLALALAYLVDGDLLAVEGLGYSRAANRPG